ncbi:MAG: hypothetical protein LKF37_13920 [Lentilactobacillus diolivorans]|jgi:hypothetical protein|nr:hypothetical protein [Lentilactobacillus diolivorans]RRG02317.1 MAG: hypothetical protein DUD34_09315 [Lactobacillus sp.]
MNDNYKERRLSRIKHQITWWIVFLALFQLFWKLLFLIFRNFIEQLSSVNYFSLGGLPLLFLILIIIAIPTLILTHWLLGKLDW